MLFNIISVVINVAVLIVLNITMYTDRASMPDGHTREWHRSPIGRLHAADQDWMLYLQIFFASVSLLSTVLVLFGVKDHIVRKVQLISTMASVVMFVIIMIVTANTHVKYA